MSARRIVSFLPAATEIIFALGAQDLLVGVSHECDFPPRAKTLPVVSRPAVDLGGFTPSQIDATISDRIGRGESVYRIDERLLRELRPDCLVTQDLCQVCAPSGNELSVAVQSLERVPRILYLTPRSLADIDRNIIDLGEATGHAQAARALVREGAARRERVRERLATIATRPRVFFAEWADPIFSSGHWVPEMIELAGGIDPFGRAEMPSKRLTWEEVAASAPEVAIVAPCGFHTGRCAEEAAALQRLPGWSAIPAVRNRRVYAVDADSYFARPGPRITDGIELLAHLLHGCEWNGPDGSYCLTGTG